IPGGSTMLPTRSSKHASTSWTRRCSPPPESIGRMIRHWSTTRRRSVSGSIRSDASTIDEQHTVQTSGPLPMPPLRTTSTRRLIPPTPPPAAAATTRADDSGRGSFAKPETPQRLGRVRTFDVQHIKGDLTLDLDKSRVSGTVTHTLKPLHPGFRGLDLDCG